jgi:polyhydroxybutyrate depolymerase
MNKIFCLILSFSAFLLSCMKSDSPTPSAASQKTETTIIDGLSREYIIYLPFGYNTTTCPLLFVLHGGGGTDTGAINLASFNNLAETEKFIVVYPQGIDKSWNDGRPTSANQLGVNDVNFFRTLIQNFSTQYKIDAKKIYATGLSNGGFMSSRLGVELGDKIAAFAAVAATVEKNTIYPSISGTNSVSALYIHGTADPLVPFAGGTVTVGAGGVIASHAEAVGKWVLANNCSTLPVTTNIPDIAADGTTSVRRDFNGGTKGSAVVSIVITNGGHTWPQGQQYVPPAFIGITSEDFNGVQTVWDFFKAHPKQ